jgi:conjugal transfer/type IV secretion protein DotA/TraY
MIMSKLKRLGRLFADSPVKVLLGLLLGILPSVAMADPSFGFDFGQKVINWIAYGTDTPVWGTVSLMSTISSVINSIALTVMAWLAVIGGSSYVIQTANKGVPGGQVISSFWYPIRTSVAVILLVPLTSGFSTLQYGVVSVAEKGNAHANIVMGAGLDYLYDFGAYRSPALEDGGSLIFSWIGSEVCKQYINSYTHAETVSAVYSKTSDRGKLVSTLTYSYNEKSTWFWKNDPRTDYCGAITFSSDLPSSGDQTSAAVGGPALIQAGQLDVLKAVQPSVAAIAALILSDESALRALQSSGSSAQSTYEKAQAEVNGKIAGAVSKYNAAVALYNSETQKLVTSAVNKINSTKNAEKAGSWKGADDGSSVTGWKEQTKEIGWPVLGTIFWQINTNQSAINKLASTMSATYTDPSLDGEWLQDQRLGEISTRIRGLKKAVYGNRPTMDNTHGIPTLSAIADAGAEGSGFIDKMKSAVYGFFAGAMRSMLFNNSPDDMMINLQYFGSAAGTAAEIAWWAKTITVSAAKGALATVDGAVDSANSFGWYNPIGWAAKFAGPAAKGVVGGLISFIDDISGLINYLILALIMVGFTLGIVLPTIPLVIWFMGVISWMLFYIECLLISPLWLSAHGTAERDGWGSEHTRQGYMLMIGLYLNPILRVCGFFAIFLAMKPVGYLVSWFIDYIAGVIVGGFTFFFFFFGAMAVVAIFGYNALTRLFSLPSELFEKGLRWVNGGHEVTGDSNNEEKARHNVTAFSHKAEGAANSKSMGAKFPRPGPGGGETPKAV